MTLKQLEYFLAIAETGNMTQAAKNLNISQPPLSLQLKALEDELNSELFIRNKKSLVITKKGRLLQERTQEILNLVNHTIYDLQTMDFTSRSQIRLGTISSVCSRLLPHKIREFNLKVPHVDFQIFEGSTTSILAQIASKYIDIGVIREPFNTAQYHFIAIADKALGGDQIDAFCAVAKPEFFDNPSATAIALTELKNKPLIMHRRFNDMITNACRQKGYAPRVVCQNNEITSSLSWAAAGIGIAICPYTSFLVSPNPDVLCKTIVDPRISSRSFIVWDKNRELSPEIKSFVNLFAK